MKLKAFTLNSWKKNHARSDTWNYPLNKWRKKYFLIMHLYQQI